MKTPTNTADSGYSPPITIELIVHGQHFNVASLGPDHAILWDARPMEAGRGIVELTVDGHLTVYHIDLIDGIEPQRTRQPFLLIDAKTEAAA